MLMMSMRSWRRTILRFSPDDLVGRLSRDGADAKSGLDYLNCETWFLTNCTHSRVT